MNQCSWFSAKKHVQISMIFCKNPALMLIILKVKPSTNIRVYMQRPLPTSMFGIIKWFIKWHLFRVSVVRTTHKHELILIIFAKKHDLAFIIFAKEIWSNVHDFFEKKTCLYSFRYLQQNHVLIVWSFSSSFLEVKHVV